MSDTAKIAAYLASCFSHKTLSHAYVLLGSTQSGKAEALYAFIPAIVGSQSVHHPDIRILDTDSNTLSIGEIRELRSWLTASALVGSAKVAVIHHAERMNTEAQNALLKILEEPVLHTYIFLLTGHKSQLLPTIVSRSVLLYFSSTHAPYASTEMTNIVFAQSPAKRLRLFMQKQYEKELFPSLAHDLVQAMRARMLNAPSKSIANALYALIETTARPVGLNWQLAIECALISY